MDMMGLFGFGKPKVTVQAFGDAIIVTLPGTTFSVTYRHANGDLVATEFSGTDVHGKITMPEFLSEAWDAANAKARELR